MTGEEFNRERQKKDPFLFYVLWIGKLSKSHFILKLYDCLMTIFINYLLILLEEEEKGAS